MTTMAPYNMDEYTNNQDIKQQKQMDKTNAIKADNHDNSHKIEKLYTFVYRELQINTHSPYKIWRRP